MPGSNNEHEPSLSRIRTSEIAAQFSDLLDAVELEQVNQRVTRLTQAIDEIRRYPLENGDEPASIFRPIGKEQP